MKKFFLLLLPLLALQALRAAPIDSLTARGVAEAFLARRAAVRGLLSAEPLRGAAYPAAYLFSRGGAFVLVAADDAQPALLGYGEGAAHAPLPAALEALLRRPAAAAYPPVGAQWTPVAPLLTTVRHQEAPYNAACPYYRHADGSLSPQRCVVGCVATAMEQILTYHRRVYTLRDTLHGWQTAHYDVPDVLPGATVDTRLIRDDYDDGASTEAELDAVARLSYYLGVACEMQWGPSSSGAYSSRLAEPLRRAFGLGYVNHLDSYQYAPAAYWNYLAAEVAARRPVYYAGSLMRTGGHAFVLDGLDADGLFHVNWGYGGYYDGYFRLDVLAHPQPEADREDTFDESGFFCNQEAITVNPDPLPEVCPPDTLHRTGREVVVERMWFDQEPVADCPTRLRMIVRNEADTALTTPFALLLNAPTDTARFEQASWLAYTGRTLAAGQRDTLIVHLRLDASGPHLLSVTPDGLQLLDSLAVDISAGGTTEVDTDEPLVGFPDEETAEFTQTFRNPSATERAAEKFVYDLQDRADGTDRQIEQFIYLEPNEVRTETVRFRRLRPDGSYCLRLRRNWPVVERLNFEMPGASAVETVATDDPDAPVAWFGLDGRRIGRPAAAGVYLKRQGGTVRKVLVR